MVGAVRGCGKVWGVGNAVWYVVRRTMCIPLQARRWRGAVVVVGSGAGSAQ